MPINSFLYPGAKFIPSYEVANSLRFNSASADSLTRSTSGAGTSNTTFTISLWVKKSSNDSAARRLLEFYNNSSYYVSLRFRDDVAQNLDFYSESNGSAVNLRTNRGFRDQSAWYHIVMRVDTTQSTADDRLRMYINGVQETSFAARTNPSSSENLQFNGSGVTHLISQSGSDTANDRRFNGYMAEVVFLDGQSLGPTSFGEFDSDSPTIWKPIDVSGLTFGNNGFYLDFEDSSNLGNDVAGSNNFTANNLAATDQTLDTCTNNFCTVNPLDQAVGTFDISEGNLKYERTSDTTNWKSARGTIGIPNAGKWYWEMAKVGGSNDGGFGGIATDVADLTQEVTGFWGFHDGASNSNYTIYSSGYTDVGSSYNISDDDIIQIAFDRDNNKLWVGRNNTWGVNGGTPVSPSDPASGFLNIPANVLPAFMIRGSFQCVVNFGQDSSFAGNLTGQNNSDGNGHGDFYYTPPSGYLALCTKNVGSDGG